MSEEINENKEEWKNAGVSHIEHYDRMYYLNFCTFPQKICSKSSLQTSTHFANRM